MKINGEPFKEIEQPPPHPSFTIYKVKLKGGPADGLITLAGNTRVVYCEGHEYHLNENGDFVYRDPARQ